MGRYYTDLCENASVFQVATDINVALLDENGVELEYFGDRCEYCDLIQQDEELEKQCRKLHQQAGEQSASLGDCYFFVCHANMIHFSIALFDQDKYAGSVLAGPLLSDYPDAASLDYVIKKCNIPPGCRALFFAAMKDVLLLDPKRIYHLGKLLYRLIYGFMSEKSNQKMQNRQKMEIQQDQIGVSIYNIKRMDNVRNIQESQERELAEKIEAGDLEEAQVLLNDILGGIYFMSGNDLELIKIRMNELITVLSRRMIQSGVSSEEIYATVNEFQKKSVKSNDLVEISFELGLVLRRFVEMMADSIRLATSGIVHKGLEFIHRHYRDQITLEQTASYAAASITHFSRIFKAEVGIGFSAYVNNLRLEKAKQLLTESELSLSEITQQVGYNNQQYFSKVFKSDTGMTPGKYRRENKKV